MRKLVCSENIFLICVGRMEQQQAGAEIELPNASVICIN